MNDARQAGFKVAVLTNDGVGIAGKEFFDSRPEFQILDVFVDAREFDQPSPSPSRICAPPGSSASTLRRSCSSTMPPCAWKAPATSV